MRGAGSGRSYDVVVIGGGFYGLRIATLCASAGKSTLLVERSAHFMSRASFNNQARVHGGYHYPRSVLTALRARQHYARFIDEFAPAIDRSFRHIYAIARYGTKVGAREFIEFCRRIGAPLSPAPADVARRFDSNFIEQAFVADEVAFNPTVLADLAIAEARAAAVEFAPDTSAVAVRPGGERGLTVDFDGGGADVDSVSTDWVINATYSSLNDLLGASGLAPLALVHEITEVALVQVPPALQFQGVTVMDGRFWSSLPFPAVAGRHSLTHVRYTPHFHWRSDDDVGAATARALFDPARRTSHAPLMLRDATRFLPEMKGARPTGSLWEVKTVLPRSAGDDSRPILVHEHADAPGLISVLGAKIDSVYDVEDEIRARIDLPR